MKRYLAEALVLESVLLFTRARLLSFFVSDKFFGNAPKESLNSFGGLWVGHSALALRRQK